MPLTDAAWRSLIGAMHGSGRKASLAITGGGSGAIAELLRIPGGSRLLVEAQVPYDESALSAFLGAAPASPIAPPPWPRAGAIGPGRKTSPPR